MNCHVYLSARKFKKRQKLKKKIKITVKNILFIFYFYLVKVNKIPSKNLITANIRKIPLLKFGHLLF